MPGGAQLKAEVLSTSACSLCGACLDWCPYLKNLEDHLVLRFDCPVNDGRCYRVCPRTMTDWCAVQQQCLPDLPTGQEMGGYLEVYRARAANLVSGQQDGGVVSTLLLSALREKMVDGLLLTGCDEGMIPRPLLTNDEQDVFNAAGSRFLANPGLRKLIEAQKQGWKSLAAVGRPCQVQALRKIQVNQMADKTDFRVLSIGLFCMWSLSWSFLDYLQSRYAGITFSRMAIPQHQVEMSDGEQIYSVSTEEVREYVRPGCKYCLDMTSELSDISVGAFEAETGWNTVVVRSTQGATLLEHARQAGMLEFAEYPADELERLKLASLRKKLRGLETIESAVNTGKITSFIDMDAPVYKAVKELAEGKVKP